MSQQSDVATAHYDAVIVGAGVSGIYLLQRLVALGLNVRTVDAASGVGGTWFWNRYPDARFDTDVISYQYYHDTELLEEWDWSEHFAGQEEIERYLNHAVDRWDLRQYIQLDTKVEGAVFDESRTQWDLSLSTGETFSCKYFVSAAGMLSAPYVPELPNKELFQGVMHHTSMWPTESVDFAGKKVAVIGTGSTGIQIIPQIAKVAESLTVFQRTPNWVTPLNNREVSDDEMKAWKSSYDDIKAQIATSPMGSPYLADPRKALEVDEQERIEKWEQLWATGGLNKVALNFSDIGVDAEANRAWCEFISQKVRSIVTDKAVADLLIPTDHAFGGKRPPMGTNYYETFNRDNVELIDLRATPIVTFTTDGIETTDGAWDFDVVVFATGFEAMDGAMLRMNVRGEGGLELRDAWVDGPVTTFGVAVPGFPNMLMVGGAHAAATFSVPRGNEPQIEFVVQIIERAEAEGSTVIRTTDAAGRAWTDHVAEAGLAMPLVDRGSWFFSGNIPGKKPQLTQYAGGPKELKRRLAEAAANGFAGFELSK